MRQLVVFIIFIGLSAAIECWREQRDSEKTTHTKDKTKVQCPGCNYCVKFVLTGSIRGTIWDCGCEEQNDLGTCTREGHESDSSVDPNTGLVTTLDWYCCAKNKCNSTGAARPKWALVLLAILSVFMGKFL
ncbi:unnamed protein product, partial [Mesorhabditis belari]|uniref:Uncharacterized protein n=1 Tax=Mesorhabditis belari TaxID=2138241 RepID=A0AAF3F9L7_9BILA